jgi:hypothetical protein
VCICRERAGSCLDDITYYDAIETGYCYRYNASRSISHALPSVDEYVGSRCNLTTLDSSYEVDKSCSKLSTSAWTVARTKEPYGEWRKVKGSYASEDICRRLPTQQPSRQPSSQPSSQPTCIPTSQPTRQPSGQPSRQPSSEPSGAPSCGAAVPLNASAGM